ncbi:MAG TPA: RidA family protein [Gemmatimonadales bacterium]|nr:RidA family protein [Gemmatimonadales bacterium]
MSGPLPVQPRDWPRPRGYSNAMAASGRVVAVAGQVGWNPVTERIETADFSAQVRLALANIATVLAAAGAEPGHVVRLTWYITDRAEYLANRAAVGAAYRELFGTHYPAMTLVVVSELLEEGAKVEIEATAVVPE